MVEQVEVIFCTVHYEIRYCDRRGNCDICRQFYPAGVMFVGDRAFFVE